MDLQLAGRTAVVTGASRGIGLAVTEALTKEGVRVVGAARTVTPELNASAAVAVSADLSTREATETGDADSLSLAGFLDTDDQQWQRLFDLNLFSAVWTTRAALPSLLARGGVIVNISSINSRVPSTGPVGYSEAKAALTAFSKRLSEEFGPQGVRVNTISPGVVGTALWRGPDGIGARLAAAHGLGQHEFMSGPPNQFGMASPRITEPEEVAALVAFIAFIASDAAANIIGSDIVIDGGTIKTS